jgi:hypothetical protein
MLSLANARDGALAYAAGFTIPNTKQAALVVGFPEQNGLVLMADKQP